VIEGLGRGLFSVGKGVFGGVIGVVETPYKEIKKGWRWSYKWNRKRIFWIGS